MIIIITGSCMLEMCKGSSIMKVPLSYHWCTSNLPESSRHKMQIPQHWCTWNPIKAKPIFVVSSVDGRPTY